MLKNIISLLCLVGFLGFSFAGPTIYISNEVAKVSPYNASGALATYIFTQNLWSGWIANLTSGSRIETYNFGSGSEVSYKGQTDLVFASGVVNFSLRDMIGNSGFGEISIAPQSISSFNSNNAEGVGLQDYAPFPLFLSGSRYRDERGGGTTSKNALLFEFPDNSVGFGARFGDIESNSLGTLAELKLFDFSANLITGVSITNNYSETSCGGNNVQTSPSLCGNEATRYIGRHDITTGNVRYMLLEIGDDDANGNRTNQDSSGWTEHLSFIGPTLATINYIPSVYVINSFTGLANILLISDYDGVIKENDSIKYTLSYYRSGNSDITGFIAVNIGYGANVLVGTKPGFNSGDLYYFDNLDFVSGETGYIGFSILSTINQTGVFSVSANMNTSGITSNYIYSINSYYTGTVESNTGSNNTGTVESNTGSNNTGTVESNTGSNNTGTVESNTGSNNTGTVESNTGSNNTGTVESNTGSNNTGTVESNTGSNNTGTVESNTGSNNTGTVESNTGSNNTGTVESNTGSNNTGTVESNTGSNNTGTVESNTGSNNTGTVESNTGSNNTGTYIYYDNGGAYYQRPMYIKNEEIVYYQKVIEFMIKKNDYTLDDDQDEFEKDIIKKSETHALPNTGVNCI